MANKPACFLQKDWFGSSGASQNDFQTEKIFYRFPIEKMRLPVWENYVVLFFRFASIKRFWTLKSYLFDLGKFSTNAIRFLFLITNFWSKQARVWINSVRLSLNYSLRLSSLCFSLDRMSVYLHERISNTGTCWVMFVIVKNSYAEVHYDLWLHKKFVSYDGQRKSPVTQEKD